MGTNVYAIRKNLSKEIIDLLQQKQSLQTYKEINDKIEENKIHIGKRSAGWKFLFNHNDWKYYDYTEQSIKDFLKSCDAIVTEYDEPLTVDEFWEKFVIDFKDGWDGEQYYIWELDRAGREKYALSKEEAKILYDAAKKRFWYEKQYCNDVKIPYDTLDYRFSDFTEFC